MPEIDWSQFKPLPEGQATSDVDWSQFKPVQDSRPWSSVAKEAAGNILPSAVNYGKGIYDAVTNPEQSLQALGGVTTGAIQKAAKAASLGIDPAKDKTASAEAVGQMILDRYGDVESFKRTLAEDPVGVLADFASIPMAAGAGLKGASIASGSAKLGRAGEVASAVGNAIEPVGAASRAVSKAGGLVMDVPAKLYGSALKPSTTLEPAERAAIVDAGLANKIPVNEKGLALLQDIKGPLRDELDKLIKEAAARGVDINPAQVVSRLDKLEAMAGNTTNPSLYLPAIQGLRDEFLANNSIAGIPVGIPVDRAQAMKSNTYRMLRQAAYGEQKAPGVEAQKQLARGLKEEIDAAVPGVDSVNRQLGPLIGLSDQLDRALGRTGNWNLLGIQPALMAAAGGPGGAAQMGIIGKIVDNPTMKSRVAMALDEASRGNYTAINTPEVRNWLRVAGEAYQANMEQGGPNR